MAASTSSSRALFPILLVNFIGTLGFSIVLPFLVVLVLKFGGNQIIYGIMGATYSLFQLIGAPVLGKWSDIYGRRKILMLSQAGTFIAWVIFLAALLSPNQLITHVNSNVLGVFTLTVPLILLFLARAIDGITGGNVSVANAYLADISTDQNRKKNFGKMSASGNLGFIIGPALAGVLGSTMLGDMLPVLMAMIISLMAIFIIFYQLEECNSAPINRSSEISETRKILGFEHKECHDMGEDSSPGWRDILLIPKIKLLLVLYFLIFLAFNFFYVAFPVHAIQKLHWDVFQLGVFFSILSGMMVLVQGPVLSYLSNKIKGSILIVAGCILLAVSFYLFSFSSTVILYFALIMFSLGNGIMWPSFMAVLSSAAGVTHQGVVQGFASSMGSLASIFGLLIGGIIYGVLQEATFLLPAGLMIIIFLVCIKLVVLDKEP